MADEKLQHAERIFRPSVDDLLDAWRTLVTAEREQVERLPNRPRPEDFYAPVAEDFRSDPRRDDDPVLERTLGLARADETWLDVGAGGDEQSNRGEGYIGGGQQRFPNRLRP